MPGGRFRPPVIACILSATSASALPRASFIAATIRSSRISTSSGLSSDGSMRTRLDVALAVDGDRDEAAAGGAVDRHGGDLLLDGLHLLLKLLRLLHHSHQVANRHCLSHPRRRVGSSAMIGASSDAGDQRRLLAASPARRRSRRPGKRASTAATSGSARASSTRRSRAARFTSAMVGVADFARRPRSSSAGRSIPRASARQLAGEALIGVVGERRARSGRARSG